MKTYFRILRYAAPYPLHIAVYAICTILTVLLSGISLILLDPVMKLLFSNEAAVVTEMPGFGFSVDYFKQWLYFTIHNQIEQQGKSGALLFSILIIVGLNILGNIFRYISNVFQSVVKTKAVMNLRNDLFYSLTDKTVAFIEKKKKGDLLNNLTTDVQEVENSVVNTMEVVFKDPLYILFFLYLMFDYSLTLSGFIFLVLPVSAAFISVLSKSLRKTAHKSQSLFSNMISVVDETISGIRIIKAFNAEAYTRKVFSGYNKSYRYLNFKYLLRRHLASPFSESMGVITVGLILWFGGRLVFNGQLEPNEFIAYVFLFTRIMQPAKSLSNAFGNIYKGIASGDRIFELADTKVSIANIEHPIKIPSFNHAIEFESVDFSYTEQPVIQNFSAKIEKGKYYALIGPSGCGKSTIAELLFRFYDPQNGEIRIDGCDIRTTDIKDLRGLMALVTQEPILFNDSIVNNIAFGLQGVSQEDVIEAAKSAHAHEFIMEMPDGYDTHIGDRGVLLSGGQRQRISIARAILKNPSILILDEATSALDNESERIVQNALDELMKNRTSLVIAHRLSTIVNADEIWVMNNGRIVERGNHDTLISQNGYYAKLQNQS